MNKIWAFFWQNKISVRIIALINLAVAIDFWFFWWDFYHGKLFDSQALANVHPHFEGYMAWETSFTVPDMILSCVLLISALLLLKNHRSHIGRDCLLLASGALMFLGILDFNYSIHNGMYFLGMDYSLTLLSIGIGLPILSIANIIILFNKRD